MEYLQYSGPNARSLTYISLFNSQDFEIGCYYLYFSDKETESSEASSHTHSHSCEVLFFFSSFYFLYFTFIVFFSLSLSPHTLFYLHPRPPFHNHHTLAPAHEFLNPNPSCSTA